MPAQDRVRSDEAVTTQCAGQPPHERGEHGPVRPLQARTRVCAMQDGDLVTQHEELDVLGGGRAAQQQDQAEHLPEDQIQQSQRHTGIMPSQRSPLVSDPSPTIGTPQGSGETGQAPLTAWRTAEGATDVRDDNDLLPGARPPHERSNANITADSWPPTLNNVTGQVIKSACLTPSPPEQIALCVSGS